MCIQSHTFSRASIMYIHLDLDLGHWGLVRLWLTKFRRRWLVTRECVQKKEKRTTQKKSQIFRGCNREKWEELQLCKSLSNLHSLFKWAHLNGQIGSSALNLSRCSQQWAPHSEMVNLIIENPLPRSSYSLTKWRSVGPDSRCRVRPCTTADSADYQHATAYLFEAKTTALLSTCQKWMQMKLLARCALQKKKKKNNNSAPPALQHN